MTMRELAILANCSLSTVSKAFNNADDISEETKQFIFDIAKQHGCFGKFYKKKFPKKIIAIICPEIGSSFYTNYVERLQRIIEKNNGIAIISTDNFSDTHQAELIEYYASYLQVDGIFVVGLKEPLKRGYDIPVISILSSIDSTDSVQVNVDPAIFEAVALLKSLGHTNIAFIGESLTKSTEKTFYKAMEIPTNSNTVIRSNFRFEKAGEDGINQLFAKNINFTAVICAYDNIAFGAIKQIKKQGYSVPQDFSVIGINNINTSEYAETALTTIDSHPDEVCEIAWELMSKKHKNKFYRSNQQIILTGRLILRESVAERKRNL